MRKTFILFKMWNYLHINVRLLLSFWVRKMKTKSCLIKVENLSLYGKPIKKSVITSYRIRRRHSYTMSISDHLMQGLVF